MQTLLRQPGRREARSAGVPVASVSDDSAEAPIHVPPIRSPLAARAAEAFGLPTVEQSPKRPPIQADPTPARLPKVGEIVLLNGPSGGGKSTRLRQLSAAAEAQDWQVFNVDRVRLRPVPSVDQFGSSGDAEADLEHAAGLLSRVGLGEACLFLRLPHELSDGQRWRLRLAVILNRVMRTGRAADRPNLIIADEFCAILDRVSAAIVARSLRRTIDRLTRVGLPLAAAVATSHDDLRKALIPNRVEWCEAVGSR